VTVTRSLFVHAGPPWIFYVLAGLAVAVFGLGVWVRLVPWWRGRGGFGRTSAGRIIRNILVYGLLGARIWRRDFWGGLAHVAVLWSFSLLFLGTILLSIHDWLIRFLVGPTYLIYSFILDLAGLVFIGGLVLLLLRRYVWKRGRMEAGLIHAVVPGLLLLIAVTGFLAEGLRLAEARPPWAGWSFVGAGLAQLFTARPPAWLMTHVWWVHAMAALSFIAWLPWSKLWHAVATPVSLGLDGAREEVLTAEELEDLPGEFLRRDMLRLDACTRCNRCETVCPSFAAGEPWSPREFLRRTRDYVRRKYTPLNKIKFIRDRNVKYLSETVTIDPDVIFLCSTCAACEDECPAGLTPLSLLGQIRSTIIEDGTNVPADVAQALDSIGKYQTPWQQPPAKRLNWAKDLEVPEYDPEEGGRLLYFVGCTTAADLRAQAIARAVSGLLGRAGVAYGVLGPDEPCCGDVARRLGEAGLFEMLVEDNSETLADLKPSGIVTSSPHCAYTLAVDYPPFVAKLAPQATLPPVAHYSQALADLINQGRLAPTVHLATTATFHDPCYLGRRLGEYEAPRRVLGSIPGLELVEMEFNRSRSVCCGGGGGRMWVEPAGETSMAVRRAAQAAATGAELLVTACPWCLIMLTDAVKTGGFEDQLEVVDLAELLARSCAA
jgi:Fe-S oxidoreductase/nitrate reductase gamma subunit